MNSADADKPLTLRQRRIYDFLQSKSAGVLATVDPNGEPHAVVIYYLVDKDFNIRFLTKTGTKKYDNLTKNNHIVIVVYDEPSQTIAQVIGKAFEIEDSSGINEIAAKVLNKCLESDSFSLPPISKLDAGDCTAFKIVPDQIRIASYDKASAGDYSKIFDSIESFVLKEDLI